MALSTIRSVGDIVEAKSHRHRWWRARIDNVHPNGLVDVCVLDVQSTNWTNMPPRSIRDVPRSLIEGSVAKFGPERAHVWEDIQKEQEIWCATPKGRGELSVRKMITSTVTRVVGGLDNLFCFTSKADAEKFQREQLAKEAAFQEAALVRRTAERKAQNEASRRRFGRDEEAITAGMEAMAAAVPLTPVTGLEEFLRKHVNVHAFHPPKYKNHRDKWAVGKNVPASRGQHEAFAYKTHDNNVHIVWLKRTWKRIPKTAEIKKHWVVSSTVVDRPIPQRSKKRKRG